MEKPRVSARLNFWKGCLMNKLALILGLAVSVAAPSFAFADGDAVAGKEVYKKCMACHTATEEKNKVGPHQVGIVGRKAAAVEGFKYSDALKAKGAEGMVWDEANLAAYLKDPKGFIAGNKMAFAGLKDDADIANVIAYLKADPKP
jgi:cytochrome c